MAIDEGDQADASGAPDDDASEEFIEDTSDASTDDSSTDGTETDDEQAFEPVSGSPTRVGSYTWADFMTEFGYEDDVSTLYPDGVESNDRLGLTADGPAVPRAEDWERVSFDPTAYLGVHPDDVDSLIRETAGSNAKYLWNVFLEHVDPETTPVTKDVYSWEHYKWEYYYESDGSRPRTRGGEIERFDGEEALGFDPDEVESRLNAAGAVAMALDEVVEENTVNVSEEIDEDDFFSDEYGNTTVANRYDLEKAVPPEKKRHFVETERYWVNKPYAFVVIFHSEKENEKKYYAIEPYCNDIESELQEFLSGKLRTAIKYGEDEVKGVTDMEGRREVIDRETRRLLDRYDLYDSSANEANMGLFETVRQLFADDEEDEEDEEAVARELDGLSVRPEPVILEEDPDTLSEYQVEKLLYMLKRDFIGYERIDPIKHDINVEDISCDGYDSPVFVYHSGYEQIISNIYHGEDDLDDFVVKLAQRSGKGISKRLPQVDATLPDGSRAQLTLGQEVSDHGTNYTIRQFKDVPFTPIDLINWNTFSLDEMAFLWLCIENHKSLIFAGGTASGKTTSLNAVSLFIPANTKIVSIEDTREVELPQRNWIASMTRPSFSDDATGDIDEFDLLEAALRQRPDYIVMGEIRGEEGRTLFQVMSTGHTTYTTFHADSVDEVLKRFTTEPINVSKTMFTALDLVSIQTQTRVQGGKVRRNKSLTEINHYEAENDEINVQDVYQWQAETDEYLKMGDSNTLDEIMFDRGWDHEKLQDELFKRKVILAYLIKNELNTYAEVAATVQAFINDPETTLTLIANGTLEESLEDLRQMESVLIDVDVEKEELVPRPDPTTETYNLSMDLLERAEESLFDEYRGATPGGLAGALSDVEAAESIPDPMDGPAPFDAAAAGETGGRTESFEFDGSTGGSTGERAAETPSWLEDDAGTAEASADAGTAATDTDSVTAETSADGAATAESANLTTEEATVGASVSGRSELPDRTDAELESGVDLPALEGATVESPTDESVTDSTESGRFGDEPSEPNPFETAEPVARERSGKSDSLDALFTDMDDTLEELEAAKSDASSSASTDTEAEEEIVETAEFDELFPESDIDSIFEDGVGSGDDEWTFASDAPDSSDDDVDSAAEPSEGGSDGDEDSIFGESRASVFDDSFESTSDSPAESTDSSDGAAFPEDTSDEPSIFSDDRDSGGGADGPSEPAGESADGSSDSTDGSSKPTDGSSDSTEDEGEEDR